MPVHSARKEAARIGTTSEVLLGWAKNHGLRHINFEDRWFFDTEWTDEFLRQRETILDRLAPALPPPKAVNKVARDIRAERYVIDTIKETLKTQKVKKYEIAAATGISTSLIYRLLSGDYRIMKQPGKSYIVSICNALEMDANKLYETAEKQAC